MSEPTPVTTEQLSALHDRLTEAFGIGIDPAVMRRAVEASGFVWDRPTPVAAVPCACGGVGSGCRCAG